MAIKMTGISMHSTNMASPKPSRKRLVSRVLHLDTRAKVLLNSPSVSPDGSVIGESHSGPASAVAPYSPVRLTRGRPRSLSGQLVTPWYSCVSPSMEEELVIPGPWWLDEQDDITGTHLSRYGHDGHGDLAEDIYPIATSPASSLSSGTSKLPLSTNAKLTRRPSRKLMVAVPDLRWIVRKCTPGSIENVPAVDESVSVQKTKQRTRSGSDAHSRLLALLATIRELNRTSFLPRAKRLVSRSDRRRSQSSRTTSDGFGESQKISSSDAPVTTKTEVQQVVHNFSSMKGAEVHNAIITGPSTGELLVNNIADDKTTEHENFPAVVPLVAKFMVKQRSDFPLQINRHHVPVSPISNKKQWSALFSDPKHVPANINSPKVPATIVIAKSRDKAKIPVKSSIAKGSKLANFNNPSINHDSEFKKKCRGLRKRLHAIEQLEARLEAGDVLELNQVEKVQTKTILQTELDDLLSSQERACQSGFELPRAQMPVQSVRNMFAGEIDVCNVSNAASEADGTWQTPKPKRRSRIKATQRLDAESVEVEACVKTLDGHELSGLELLEQESGKSHQSANSSLLDISLTATDIKEKPKELSVHQTISASAVEDHVEHNMPSSAPDVNPGKLDEQLVTPSISKNLAKNQRKRQMLKERKRKARTSEICTNTPETDAIVSSPAPATYSESSETNSCNSDDEMPWPQRFALLKVEADHRMQVCSDRHLGRIDGMIKEWNAFFPERAIDCNMSGIELPVSTSVTTTKPAEDFPIEDAFELRDHVEQADMLLDLCHTRLLQRIVEARERKNQELESSIQGVASNPIQPASLQESQAHPSSTKIEKSQVKECSFVAALPREMKHIVKLLDARLMAKLQAVENLEVTLRARRHLETGREAERTAGQIDHVLQKKHELLIQLNTNASKVMLQTSDEAAQSTPCPADVEPRIYSEPAFSSLECEVAPSTWSFLRRQPFFIRTIAQYVQRTIAAIKTCMTPAKLLAERVFCKSSKSRMRLWCSRERVVEQSIGDESHGIPRAKLRGFRVSPWEGLAELAMDNPLGDFGATMELQEHYYQLIRGVCPPRLWPLRNRRIDHTRLDMHDEYLRRRVSFENRVSMKELELLLNRWAGWMGKSLASRLWRRGMGGNAARISEEWEVV